MKISTNGAQLLVGARLRFLEKMDLGRAGDTYCIRLEPPQLREEDLTRAGALDVAERAFSIYHDLHTTPIVDAWHRINQEVKEQDEKLAAIRSWCESNVPDEALRNMIQAEIERLFKPKRLKSSLTVVEPSSQLGKTLEFDRKTVEENIRIGFRDMLKALRAAGKIDDAEKATLQKSNLFPEEASL